MPLLAVPPGWLGRKRAYLDVKTPRFGYVGWLKFQNFGDEYCYRAIRSLFAPLQILPEASGRLVDLIERAQRRPLYDAGFLGGGTLINDAHYLEPFTRVLDRSGLGFVFGTGVYDPKENFLWRRDSRPDEWTALLGRCAFVGVRGPRSLEILKQQGFADARVIGDPMLWLADDISGPRADTRTLCVNLGVSAGRVRGGEEAVFENAFAIVKPFLDEGWAIRLLPVWPPDVEPLRKFAVRLGVSPRLVHEDFLNFESVMRLLRESSVLLAEKLHAGIAGICANTPTVMLAYQDKCRDFMASVNLERFCFDTASLDVAKVSDAIREAHADRPLRSAMLGEVQRLRGELARAKDTVCGILGARRGIAA